MLPLLLLQLTLVGVPIIKKEARARNQHKQKEESLNDTDSNPHVPSERSRGSV